MPERRCLACGARSEKPALARFVAVPAEGAHELRRDDRALLGGRGLYVCRRRECFERAVARRGFHRGARLGGELTIDPALGAAVGMEGQWGT
ncbi:MAG: YlxR family protein [Thermoleophilia bacterium]